MSNIIDFAKSGELAPNVFSVHGIEHLSPSSISKFASAPALFVLEKLLGHKGKVGCAAYRGTAAEAGIAHGLLLSHELTGESARELIEEGKAVALKEFDRLAVFSADPRKEKERDALAGFVEIGLRELLPYGVPSSMQPRVEMIVDGLAVPIIGFADFLFGSIVVDLKTSHAVPSEVKRNHAKQVALYAHCLGASEARISYCSAKKCATYRVDNLQAHLDALVKGAFAVQRFLSVSSDPNELAGFVMPDLDSFYYNDPETRQFAYEIFGV